jgi:SAM-dependent methyltransferase
VKVAEISLKTYLRPVVRRLRRLNGRLSLHIGRISSLTPLSASSGFDRGTPIDRYYIERFLAAHRADVRGRVLEIGTDIYSRKLGGDQISRQDILHIDPSNPAATIVGDIADPETLPSEAFDCMIVTQTLQYVYDVRGALGQIRRALAPGGVALITVPFVAPISPDAWQDSYYWGFSAAGLERLLGEAFEGDEIEIAPFGNLYAATTFLHGAAAEEVRIANLQPVEPRYAIVVVARVKRTR